MGELMRALNRSTSLSENDRLYLRQLVREWHLIADLAFSDLVLWAPDPDPDPAVLWAIAQIRPTTGPTALLGDVVGEQTAHEPHHLACQVFETGEVLTRTDARLRSGIPVDVVAFPVRTPEGRVIGVVERHTNRMGVRAPGALEDAYLEIADLLTGMVTRGEFPLPGDATRAEASPRVGDGLIWAGPGPVREIMYASPNAISNYRRLGLSGDLVEQRLDDLVHVLLPHLPKELVDGGQVVEFDLEHDLVTLRVRVMPLRDVTGRCGFLILLRDVSELRTRERELVTKDATIREIHHRVKNNLQTVAALLRMQSRRMQSAEARIALRDAMSRVGAIAAVHEMLSQSYDDDDLGFDDVADKVLAMVGDVAGRDVRVLRRGVFGRVPSAVATALSMVVTELCQNAIEHGLCGEPGTVEVVPHRDGGWLEVQVIDQGRGLPADFTAATSSSLGLSIVRTLVQDLDGTFELMSGEGHVGSVAKVRLPLGKRDRTQVGFN